MKVHFFTKGDERVADSRQRAFRIAEELNARGVEAVIEAPPSLHMSLTPWPKKFSLIMQLLRSLSGIKKGDIVFLQRAISNKYFFVIIVAYLKIFRRKMIFDFDDAIYLHDPFKTILYTKMADAVIICSQALKKWALQYNPHVYIIHTTVSLSKYEKFTKDYSQEREKIVIGWVGTAKDHHKNLALLKNVFEKLVQATDIPFKFVLGGILGDKESREMFEHIPGLEVEFVDSIPPNELPQFLQEFDIAVNPLAEKSEWNFARSSLKPYDYMAVGLAQITSAVGEITNVIHDGVNGFTADSAEEWVEKLIILMKDKNLRAQMGREGQKTMREEESFEAVMPHYIQILQEVEAK